MADRRVGPAREHQTRMYDSLRPVDAVVAAWTKPGRAPEYHRRMQEQVRADMPLLGRALDRLARERKNR